MVFRLVSNKDLDYSCVDSEYFLDFQMALLLRAYRQSP
jgi:hypothetical protein